jgi:hypothetical protein
LKIAFSLKLLWVVLVDYQVSRREREVRTVNSTETVDDDRTVPIHDADEQDETIVAPYGVVKVEMLGILGTDSSVHDIPPHLTVVVVAVVDEDHENSSLVDVQHAMSMVDAEEAMNGIDMRLLDAETIH